MGIVNVTPDSFSDGGLYAETEKAIAHGLALIKEGADSLDIGGESTRPGAISVSPEEEIERVVPVIAGLKDHIEHISIDTRYPQTMEAAIKAGATVINDISGLTNDPQSMEIAAHFKVPVILMHMQGNPSNMQDNPNYNNVIEGVFKFFEGRLNVCKLARIETDLLVLDPGIGFGKNDQHNLLILRDIKKFLDLGCPLLLGTSRKSFIGRISGDESVDKRLGGSLASILWGLEQGVQFFRVHDVQATRQAFQIYQAIKNV